MHFRRTNWRENQILNSPSKNLSTYERANLQQRKPNTTAQLTLSCPDSFRPLPFPDPAATLHKLHQLASELSGRGEALQRGLSQHLKLKRTKPRASINAKNLSSRNSWPSISSLFVLLCHQYSILNLRTSAWNMGLEARVLCANILISSREQLRAMRTSSYNAPPPIKSLAFTSVTIKSRY